MKKHNPCLTILLLAHALIITPSVSRAVETEIEQTAENFLEFTTVPDGRCQILSSRGKLALIVNKHPSQTIKYRLYRTFSGKRQAGLVIGKIEAGAEIKLGCSRVDTREQTWHIKIAKFEN